MFGLGTFELLLIGGVVCLIFGPAFLKRAVGNLRTLEKTKQELTGPGALERFLGIGEEEAPADATDEDDDER